MPPARRAPGRLLLVALALLLAVQVGVVASMHYAARDAATKALDASADETGRLGLGAAVDALAAGAQEDALREMLVRLRDARRLDQALLVDADGLVVADAAGGPSGRRASPLLVHPDLLALALATGRAQSERHAAPGVDPVDGAVRRSYVPLPRRSAHGAVSAEAGAGTAAAAGTGATARGRMPGASRDLVLLLESADPLPGVLAALDARLGLGLGMALIGTALAALAGFWLLRAYAAVQRSAERSERLAGAGAVAAGIAHEVKNPLGTVLATAQYLASRPGSDAESIALLNEIVEEARRCDDQINGFLDLVRDTAYRMVAVDLGELARSAVSVVQARARSRHIDVTAEVSPGVPCVQGDPRRLRQALINLILNGIDAQHAGGSVVVCVAQDAEAVLLRVLDRGPGIGASQRLRLHEPFFTTKPDGTGLGLGIARRIAERHGGGLDLRPRSDGPGLCAEIRVPIHGPAHADPPAGRVAAMADQTAAPSRPADSSPTSPVLTP